MVIKILHSIFNNGWVQNVVSSLVIVPILIGLASLFMNRHGILSIAGVLLTIFVWLAVWHFWDKPNKPEPKAAIATAPKPPPTNSPSAFSPSDVVSAASTDRMDRMFPPTDTGSGGIQLGYSTYEGQDVEWHLYLRSVKQSPTGQWGDLEVCCTDKQDPETFVIFNTTSSDHDFLRLSIDRNQLFKVTGTIDKIGATEIWLTNADLQPIFSTGL